MCFIHTLAMFDRFIGWVTSYDHGLQQNTLCRMERKQEKGERSDYFNRCYLWELCPPPVLSFSLSLYLFMAGDERTCSTEGRWQLLMERKQKEPSVLPLYSSSSVLSAYLYPPSSPFPVHLFFLLLIPLIHFPWFIILFRFLQLSISPLFTSSSLSLLPGLSEHSVEIGSVTVSLETDTVGLPGVSTQ